MGRPKRTYTFEKYVTDWVDAALAVLPPEVRKDLREEAVTHYLRHPKYSVHARRAIYTSKEYAWAIAHAMNNIGPAMLAILAKGGVQDLRKTMSTYGSVDGAEALRNLSFTDAPVEHKKACACPVCSTGAMKGMARH